MARYHGLSALLVCSGLLVSCQGDQGIPSDPGRGLTLTGPGPCKDAAFVSAAAIYTDASVQNSKLQACKDIQALTKQNNLSGAEVGINDLLVAIYNDYNASAVGLAAVGSSTLEQSVANYIEAACGLAPLSDSECLTPNDLDDPADGLIDDDDLKGWLAAGPLNSFGMDLATGLLGTGIFAYGVEEAVDAYVFVSQRPRTGVDGPCPQNFPNDCQDDVFDVDADGYFASVSVESCAVFGEKHVHCPEGQDCEFGETTTPLGLVLDEKCTEAGYEVMPFWGQVVFQATRPAQWLIQATPAYAGLTSKFGAFSPIVLADSDPRRREVHCLVTSNYPSGSEGTICELLNQGTVIASCTTVGTGTPYESSCRYVQNDGETEGDLLVPEQITLLATANKTSTNGAYFTSKDFEIGPGNPERGQSATVELILQPPGKKKK